MLLHFLKFRMQGKKYSRSTQSVVAERMLLFIFVNNLISTFTGIPKMKKLYRILLSCGIFQEKGQQCQKYKIEQDAKIF